LKGPLSGQPSDPLAHLLDRSVAISPMDPLFVLARLASAWIGPSRRMGIAAMSGFSAGFRLWESRSCARIE
jgi:hypothetical protein